MKIRKMVLTALSIALGIVLPMTLHAIPNAGSIFLPMHIPVFICGLAIGWPYGLICGIATPLLSSAITGMPPAPILPAMVFELAVYGVVSGWLYKKLHKHHAVTALYVSLAGAMLLGRVVMGVVQAFIFNIGNYSVQTWVTASFVTALPGIAIQLILIPLVVLALKKARVL